MAWIRTVPETETEGRIGKTYQAAIARAGRVFGIIKLMSIQPEVLDSSMAFYASVTTTRRSPLPRWFRELIAIKVSAANDCFY